MRYKLVAWADEGMRIKMLIATCPNRFERLFVGSREFEVTGSGTVWTYWPSFMRCGQGMEIMCLRLCEQILDGQHNEKEI